MTEQVLFSLPLDRLEPIFKGWVRDVLLQFNQVEADHSKDAILTINEAAELLSVSVPTIYGYVHAKSIPYMKRRGRLYFSKTEILTWITSSRRMTRDEIRQVAADSLNR